MKHFAFISLLAVISLLASGSGWGPVPTPSGDVSILRFSTTVPTDTVKDLSVGGPTDSMFCTGAYQQAVGMLYAGVSGNAWVNRLGAWVKVSSDSAQIYWTAMVTPESDSLFAGQIGWHEAGSDTLTITNTDWTFHTWTFDNSVFLRNDLSYQFAYNDASGLGMSLLGTVVHDANAPEIYGIDSSKVVGNDPAVLLSSVTSVREDSVYVSYISDGSYPSSGVASSFFNARLGMIRTLLLEGLGASRPGQSVYVTAPLDFYNTLLVQGTPTLTDTCFTSTGDMLVFVNGLITEFVSTP